MPTAQVLVLDALRTAGVYGQGQKPSAEVINGAFNRLNRMLNEWTTKRWMEFHLIDIPIPSTGAQWYTIGPGGNINIGTRPPDIVAAYLRLFSQGGPVATYDFGDDFSPADFATATWSSTPAGAIDYPLQILRSLEDYSQIALKALQSFTSYVYYDAAFPLGRIFPWPVPGTTPQAYEVHVIMKSSLGQFGSLADDLMMPPEYEAAIEFNLAKRLAVAYQIPVDPDLRALAASSLSTVRSAKSQVPRLQMPPELRRPGIYNPYTDRIT